MLPVYVASVLVLIGYFVVGQLSGSALTTSVRFALADPLGSAAIDRISRYWTPFQRNTQIIPLQGVLLANRALWLGVGAVFFVVAYVKFAFAYPAEKSKRRQLIEEKETIKPAESLPIAHPTFSTAASLRHLISLTRIQFTETTKNVFFVVLMLAGFLLAIVAASGLTDPLVQSNLARHPSDALDWPAPALTSSPSPSSFSIPANWCGGNAMPSSIR